MNRVVYLQLSVETVVVTAHNMIKIFEDTNNGNAAWKSMCKRYDKNVKKMRLVCPSDQNYKVTASHCYQTQLIT